MTFFLDDFRGQVLGRPANGLGLLVVLHDLGKAKVGELDIAGLVDDDIFGLEAG